MIITRMEDKVLRFKKFFDLNFPKVKTFAWQLLKSVFVFTNSCYSILCKQ